MASIFRKDDNFYDQPNRNIYDLSFQNNFTLNAGSIVPVFCKEVLPGDSFRIDPTFGIRAMPLVWPIQTRMKTYLHFYYVRNRNLWKDWPDFIGGTKSDLVPPYVYLTEENRDMFNTGEIGDYFGIPTVTYGEFGNSVYTYMDNNFYDLSKNSYISGYGGYTMGVFELGDSLSLDSKYVKVNSTQPRPSQRLAIVVDKYAFDGELDKYGFYLTTYANVSSIDNIEVNMVPFDLNGKLSLYPKATTFVSLSKQELPVDSSLLTFIDIPDKPSFNNARFIMFIFNVQNIPSNNSSAPSAPVIRGQVLLNKGVSFGIENADAELSDLPFISDANPTGLRLSALPFRALESVYNCIYRNAENNPLIGPDGQPEYNKWILNNEGGADTTHYKLHFRNWEDDFLTTALPSPQQGNAPLVGLTGKATINFASEDGTDTVTATMDEYGQITSFNVGNSNLSEALGEMVDYGISINDFRNVNALQRWLENNIRRGYKYQDQIKTHYGVSVRYDELDMPEFIGGSAQSFVVNQISQTVSSDDQVLGDYAGQTSCVGSGNAITHYCDEHGYIIGVLCISPIPNYSQLLPKHFLKSDKFDYFFPEFGHIGMQPIPLKEITPLQTYRQQKEDASVTLDDTFGYQRAWYEYLASTDEVHGLFRNQLRNFVMNRTFDKTPELGAEFTTIDPEQLNDVFAVQDTNHKFLGQVYFDVSAKRPIPLYGIPKLE